MTIKPPFVRSAYNYDMAQVSLETGFKSTEPSLAQQHMKEDADINNIVARFGITGELPVSQRVAQYGDFTGMSNDYHTSLNMVHAAHEAFYSLPAALRERFHNDPAKIIEFCNDESNREEAIKLGLIASPVALLDVTGLGDTNQQQTGVENENEKKASS